MKEICDDCEFASILIKCIDETLMAYGKDTRKALYEYFKKVLSLPKQKIPERIDLFSKGLEDLLGLGARSLEILVMMKLHSKIGVVWEYKVSNHGLSPDLTFAEYVSVAKKYYEEAQNYEDELDIFVTDKEAESIYR